MLSTRKRKRYAFIICAVLFLFFVLTAPPVSNAADNAELREVRFWKSHDYIRFVFDFSKPVEFTNGKLSNPERLFFDLKNTKLPGGLKKIIEVNNEFVKSVRMGQFGPDTARIVFDLSSQSYNFKILNLEDPARLVVDIFVSGPAATGKDDVKAAPKPDAPEADLQQAQSFIRRTVVIDAGHGGHDPGAIGPTGVYEKNVVLDIAIRVRQILKKTQPSYAVVLTRETDVFIPLQKRASIANGHKADLFVSVHANASANRKARGIETYLLNATNSEEALKTAARENGVSFKKMKQTQSEMDVILTSLASQNKRDESVKLAGNLQKTLVGKVSNRYPQTGEHGTGVKGAPFYVLVGAEMPASLVEVSFISNRDEEQLLKTESYRQLIAQSIADGIHKYFSSQPLQHVVSDDREDARPTAKSVNYSRPLNAR
jgi:N-acetylmuramoyl-L-alanine amidase